MASPLMAAMTGRDRPATLSEGAPQACAPLPEALQTRNATSYGLASGLFPSDLDRAAYLSRGLKAGQVYVNQWFSPGVLEAPSHGYKQSGLGGVGMEKYMQAKNVFTRIGEPS